MSEELAWAAGFFDGEGCTTIHSQKQCNYPRLRIGQSGKNGAEPLLRFQSAVGFGKVYGPYPVAKNQTKIRWVYQTTGKDEVAKIISLIGPWLGTDKKEQAKKTLGVNYPLYQARTAKRNTR